MRHGAATLILVLAASAAQAVTYAPLRTLRASEQVSSWFGSSMATRANLVLVGATSEQTGAAYLMDVETGSQFLRLGPPDPGSQYPDSFGGAVAFLGDDLLVSQWGEAVYLFDHATGALQRTFTHPDGPSGFHWFGGAIAVAGRTLIVGGSATCPLDADNCQPDGEVFVFDGDTGALRRTITNPTPDPNDAFGQDLATDGATIWVGASGDDTAAHDAGAVHAFDLATGALLRTIVSPTPIEGGVFGWALAVGGTELFVGAVREGTGGVVHRFDASSGTFIRTLAKPAPAESDQFGRAIAIVGPNVLIGNPTAGWLSDDDFYTWGEALLFDGDGNLLATFANPTPENFENESFGASVGVAAGRLVVADPFDITELNRGAVYVYADTTTCGDGTLDPGEGCDDGNLVSGDGCDANCTPTACGNAVVTAGEACDDGNLVSGDRCDSNCTPSACGNGVASPLEECDDGNLTPGDGCSATCTREVCGNGTIDPREDCDDGNTADLDGCSSACRLEPRGHFTCYKVRGRRGARRRPVTAVLEDEFGSRRAAMLKPVLVCNGDGLTDPGNTLACYRLAGHADPRATLVIGSVAGTQTWRIRRARTVCLPAVDAVPLGLEARYPATDLPSVRVYSMAAGPSGVILGAPGVYPEHPTSICDFGGVVYVLDAGGQLIRRVSNPLCTPVEEFGVAVAALGADFIASDPRATIENDPHDYTDDIFAAGAVFRLSGKGLVERAYWHPEPESVPFGGRFGTSLLALGDDFLASAPGSHTVYRMSGRSGAVVHAFRDPTGHAQSSFGASIARLPGKLLVGAPNYWAEPEVESAAYLFDSASGALLRTFHDPEPGTSHFFGEVVAAIGDMVAVATPSQPDFEPRVAGAVHLFDAASGTLQRTFHDPMGAGQRYPGTLAGLGHHLLVGESLADVLDVDSGVLHVFDTGTGDLVQTLLDPEAAPGHEFGRVVTTAGDDVLVGAIGRAYRFSPSPSGPLECYRARLPRGTCVPEPPPVLAGDRFGMSPTALGDPQVYCSPGIRDGEPARHTPPSLACWDVDGAPGDPPLPIDVKLTTALGTEQLTLVRTVSVCLPAAATRSAKPPRSTCPAAARPR